MTEAERFLVEFERVAQEAIEICRKKNADYGNPDDPFANFKDVLEDGMPVERGMTVRMRDKLRRISNLIDRPGEVTEESQRDTCIDLANYALILAVWLTWRETPLG
jgi:hypothetical protein